MSRKILIVTPSFPFPATGAEQLDRAEGVKQLVRLGYEVVVITKVVEWADRTFIEQTGKEVGARVVTVPYRYSNVKETASQKLFKHLGKLRHPLYLDGAAYEYAEPVIRQALANELKNFKPDVVWFEYTYLWPLYAQVRRTGIPIIMRSINFEPEHFIEEEGYILKNYLKYIPKWFGERKTVRESDVVLAITPKEEKIYERLGAKAVITLPLRGLPRYTMLARPEIRDRKPLHVFFMGSSYNVAHNLAAATQVIKDIAPHAQAKAPGEFVFHIFGNKLPDELQKLCDGVQIVYEGYVEDLDAKLVEMDIALAPSFMGAGMQQKVFEPIVRGIPTITSTRAIAEYPFRNGEEYVAAKTTQEYVDSLLILRSPERRKKISTAASAVGGQLFSQTALDNVVTNAIETT